MGTINSKKFLNQFNPLMHSRYCMYHVLERNKLGILLTQLSDCGCLLEAPLILSS